MYYVSIYSIHLSTYLPNPDPNGEQQNHIGGQPSETELFEGNILHIQTVCIQLCPEKPAELGEVQLHQSWTNISNIEKSSEYSEETEKIINLTLFTTENTIFGIFFLGNKTGWSQHQNSCWQHHFDGGAFGLQSHSKVKPGTNKTHHVNVMYHYIYIYMLIYIYTYDNIYIYIYTYVYIHIYIYIHIYDIICEVQMYDTYSLIVISFHIFLFIYWIHSGCNRSDVGDVSGCQRRRSHWSNIIWLF